MRSMNSSCAWISRSSHAIFLSASSTELACARGGVLDGFAGVAEVCLTTAACCVSAWACVVSLSEYASAGLRTVAISSSVHTLCVFIAAFRCLAGVAPESLCAHAGAASTKAAVIARITLKRKPFFVFIFCPESFSAFLVRKDLVRWGLLHSVDPAAVVVDAVSAASRDIEIHGSIIGQLVSVRVPCCCGENSAVKFAVAAAVAWKRRCAVSNDQND